MTIEGHTIVALPVADPDRTRQRRSKRSIRTSARERPPRVVPLFGARPYLRQRSQAGFGLTVALGFSAACWAVVAAAIF